MCGGEEEEVKLFIDVHVHLVQIHTQVLNSDRTREKKPNQQMGISIFKILQKM